MESAPRLALDTEADSLHHYFEKVCLIQISAGAEHVIVDPLAGLDLSPLLRLLSNKSLTMHGAAYDLRILRASFGFRPTAPVFDTLLAAQLLGYPHLGLAALVDRFFQVTLPKTSQRYNWSLRPLPVEVLDYASDDTRYLEPLRDILAAEIEKLGRSRWLAENCEAMVQAALSDKPKPGPDEEWRIKGSRDLDRRELAYLRALWYWRDRLARESDLPPFKIFGNARSECAGFTAVAFAGKDEKRLISPG